MRRSPNKAPNVKPVNEKKPNVKPVNEKKPNNKAPNVKPVNEKKPNVKPVNNKKPNNKAPNVKPVNNKKPNNKAPNVKPVNEKKPNVKPVSEPKVNKFANQKTLSKYLQNLGMNRGNRKTFMARLGKNKLENIQSNSKKFMNDKKKPNVKPQPKVNKFANQKTLSKYLQNLGMNRGNRKTFMARLGKNKLENIQSNAKKFMNDKKKPNVKPQPKVNKFANQKTLSKYLQNLGMNRGNRKTFMARLGKNKLENIQSNSKKFMNDKKKPMSR
jgi:CRISPR/Cas system-associated endoribonuclease Cas2